MNTRDKKSNWKTSFSALIKEAFPKLKAYRKAEDVMQFNKVLSVILSGVKKYMAGQLNRAVRNGIVPRNKYRVEELLDELYLVTYEHIHEIDEENLLTWLFQKSDELLSNIFKEEAFRKVYVENIDDLTKPEWDEMEEKMTTDADGDLILEEELDDISYPKNDYVLDDILVRHIEKGIYDKLSKDLSEKEIHQQIDFTLHHLPIMLQSIFDLSVVYQFSPDEIAEIKKMPVDEVRRHLAQAKKSIQLRFEKKYFID